MRIPKFMFGFNYLKEKAFVIVIVLFVRLPDDVCVVTDYVIDEKL